MRSLLRVGCVLLLLPLGFSCRTPSAQRASRPTTPDSLSLARVPTTDADWSAPGAIDSIVASMTLEEKVSQMVMVRAFGHYISTDSETHDRLVRIVTQRKIGGLIMAQGDVYEEAILINRLQRLSRIPLLIAADFERGVAMRVRRGTSFPDAMALGATRRPELAYRMGKAIAEEARAIGVHQNYAPVADINKNPLNPVINTRAFGDDPALVRRMVASFVRGTADGGGIATAKHFPGHGDTGSDSHLELPVLPFSRSRMDTVELSTFRAAVDSGVRSVMIAHIAVPALDSARMPASLSEAMIEGTLRRGLGFNGLAVTDAMEMQGVAHNFSPGNAAVLAVRAGIDVLLVPPDEDIAIDAIVRAVRSGEISEARINTSVRRMLMAKQALGLDRRRLVDVDAIGEKVGTRIHRALSKEIARESITILRNAGALLPLPPNNGKRIAAVLVSDTEDNRLEVQRPGSPWTSEQFGTYLSQLLRRRSGSVETIRLTPASNQDDLDGALTKMRRADVAILCLFVKVRTSSGKISLPDYAVRFADQAQHLRTPLILCAFGSPYLVADFPRAEALLCAYGDNEALTEAAVEALFGEIPVHGKLPVTMEGEFQFGSGIDIPQSQLRRDDPALAGFDPDELSHVDDLVRAAIADSAFPGAQVAIVKSGLLVYNKSFGAYTYGAGSRGVDAGTLFDLASLTKVIATTAAVMKLVDQKKVALDDPVGMYIPAFARGEKSAITLRHLLLHRGGLPPFRQLWKICPDSLAAIDSVYATPLIAVPGDTTIYSDLGMIVLGKVVERITGVTLAAFVRREYYTPLGMVNTTFTPEPWLRDRCAPTELDTVWRKRIVQGSVHDENAAFLGGVAGHAGLFSTASDLAVFMQMMLNRGWYAGRRFLGESTVNEFVGRKIPGQERWLGWDMKALRGSSAGTFFSGSAFGHTGFTGTSIWADPDRDLVVIALTNRVYPARTRMGHMKFRPALHDAVMHALGFTSGDR